MIHKIQYLSGRTLSILGPGLITGASDDDPSSIATYSQVGAQFGFNISWTMLFSYPLMAAIQEISGRIGRTRPGAELPVTFAVIIPLGC
jgi:Mn2+/Fe2+ NRAMP family transporter